MRLVLLLGLGLVLGVAGDDPDTAVVGDDFDIGEFEDDIDEEEESVIVEGTEQEDARNGTEFVDPADFVGTEVLETFLVLPAELSTCRVWPRSSRRRRRSWRSLRTSGPP